MKYKLLFILFLFSFYSCINENEIIENKDISENVELLKNNRSKLNVLIKIDNYRNIGNLYKAFNLGYKTVTNKNFDGIIFPLKYSNNWSNFLEKKFDIVIYEKCNIDESLINNSKNIKNLLFVPCGSGDKQINYIKNSRFVNKFEYWREAEDPGTAFKRYLNPGMEFYKGYDSYQYFVTKLKSNLELNKKYIIKYDILEVYGTNPIIFWVNKLQVGFSNVQIGHFSHSFIFNKKNNIQDDEFAISGFGEEYGADKTHMVIDNLLLCNDVQVNKLSLNNIPLNLDFHSLQQIFVKPFHWQKNLHQHS